MQSYSVLKYLAILMWVSCSAMAGDSIRHRDNETGLLSWQKLESGFSMRLIQLLPDYVAAVYGARGLPPDMVKIMAGYCVFGTIVRNESQQSVSYRVGNWRYITDDGIEHPIKTKTDWISEWRHMGIAFRWSILPDKQSLEPGDWNQGFTTVLLPPDSTLDLVYTWRNHDEEHEAMLEGLSCAPEKLPG